MRTPYLDLKTLGIEKYCLHRVKAFCPETNALNKLAECCALEATSPNTDFWTHKLHERPQLQNAEWSPPSPGFIPTYTVGKSAASAIDSGNGRHRIARLLRQGVGIVTHVEETENEELLVEKVHENDERNGTSDILAKLASRIALAPDKLIMKIGDSEKAKALIEETSFEIVEIIFADFSALARLMSNDGYGENERRLRRAVAYLLVRSYDMNPGQGQKSSLEGVAEEVNLAALADLVIFEDSIITVKNLSQTTRGFVALGPRGAVLAHARGFEHPNLRIATLNMIEILRGRHFNLIAARTFADETIRDLNRLAHADGITQLKENYEAALLTLLDKIMLANYLYGLVVSDPGIFLLDGSTLTRMSDVADIWLNLKSLRVDTERKMEALHRLWQHFQDSQRIHIIGKLSRSKENAAT